MKKTLVLDRPDKMTAARRPPITRVAEKGEVTDFLRSFAEGRLFYIRTYGCQANTRDEETMAGYLSQAGFQRTDDPKKADVAIINTCAVRENAEEKVYGEIGSFKANKESNPDFLLVLAGCVMGEEGAAEKLLKVYPWISLVIGTHEINKLLPLLETSIKRKGPVLSSSSFSSEVVEGMPSVRLSAYDAYVNISYGCDKFCTYCIVPYTRGRERSRKKEDVLAECARLVEEGYKQITLLGQNVNSYGLDLKDGTDFASLLVDVAKLGIPRLRFLTSYPSQFTDVMIDAMAAYPNIMPWLHLPVQSGSTSCLHRMGRRYTREEYLALVSKIRAKIPSISLTTDIIVGFPNETDEEFEDTLSLVREVGYSSAFTFIYSPRVGTPAAKMPQLPKEVVQPRFDRLKEVVEESIAEASLALVGQTVDVLVEGVSKKDPDKLSGHEPGGKLIHFSGPAYLEGAIVPVRILSSKVYSLQGELVGDPLILKAKDVAYMLSLDPLLKEFERLSSSLSADPFLKDFGDRYVAAKKAAALSMGDLEVFHTKQKALRDLLKELEEYPPLVNYESLLSEARGALLEIEDVLR